MAGFPLLPKGFLFGTATAAYQIEGAAAEDGRGPSVWDTFSHRPGTVANGDNGDVACDHYHRWREDVDLLRGLGVGGYRFSISWPRVQPDGRGRVNAAGLAFYDRLVDALLECGIAPCPTLYHWDLPQALEDDGGWLVRETAERFADYAAVLGAALGDRIARWITLNEPFVQTMFGYGFGMHAPGRRLVGDTVSPQVRAVAHHLLLGHGLAVRRLRDAGAQGPVGITNNYSPAVAASPGEADAEAARRFDVLQNRWFTDPLLLGRYPEGLDALAPPDDSVRDADLDTIAAPLDFLGANYYFPTNVRADPHPLGLQMAAFDPDAEVTAFGWPVVPDGLRDLLVMLHDRYGERLPPIYVTENGAAYDDAPDGAGSVADPSRVSYLDRHLRAVAAAVAAGVDVRGYFVWTLLDNFEWSEGFGKRFGLVYVDFTTQRRTPKSSYAWYRDVIAAQP